MTSATESQVNLDPEASSLLPSRRCSVLVDTPAHAGMPAVLDYACEYLLAPGTLVRVPLGRRETLGVVWAGPTAEAALDGSLIKPVVAVLDAIAPLSAAWCQLVDFAAAYYQRSPGELALSVLPPELRKLSATQLHRRAAKVDRRSPKPIAQANAKLAESLLQEDSQRPVLSTDQAAAVATLIDPHAAPNPVLLHGTTGSGKTEVYLRATEHALSLGRQALVLVPEINLTPQLEARFAERFASHHVVSLHSALTPAQRMANWLAAHQGQADVVLGTRLAVFASLPRLGLIVVDEEHDPSYKQQEGARYSARDMSVYRAKLEGIVVVLGSATPSLESWHHAQTGRYARLSLTARIGGAALPALRVVDLAAQPKSRGLAPAISAPLADALRDRLSRGEQSLVFLNRRGYAPVLHCVDCGWKSGCPHCSAWRVFHKLDRSLRCHHCGLTQPVPRACPDCGNLDISPIGRGTERLEEQLAELLPTARIARIDADSTKPKGELQARLGAVHAGDVDIVVGTQMVAKGHDFRRMTLVAAVNPDSALFSSDFRAPERLFALLAQAAGRAGRDAAQTAPSEMWLQTWFPRHPLYAALRHYDYAAFAASQLGERASAQLPPFSHLALLRAEAKSAAAAQGFLEAAAEALVALAESGPVSVYSAVPVPISRVADVERVQMLVESPSRQALQRALAAWMPSLHALRNTRFGDGERILRWAIDVDPAAI